MGGGETGEGSGPESNKSVILLCRGESWKVKVP